GLRRGFCLGEKGVGDSTRLPLHYKGSFFHRIVKGFVAQLIIIKVTYQCSKNVVFGKIVSGSNLLKKIEQAGSEKGKPLCLVKIVDCGEASDGKTQVAPGKEKGKSWGMQVVTKSMHVLRSSSSDSESEATSSSSSTGSERSGQRDDTRKPKHSLQSADTSVEVGK
ncbi:hypothetical protein BHE74_00052429, partial [Ensete ventricosum]